MPFGGADGLRLDRQANAPAEDTARMRDHRVCKHGVRFPGSCASTLMACTRAWVAAAKSAASRLDL